MKEKILSSLVAISMMISSTILPLSASKSYANDENTKAQTIMSETSSQSINIETNDAPISSEDINKDSNAEAISNEPTANKSLDEVYPEASGSDIGQVQHDSKESTTLDSEDVKLSASKDLKIITLKSDVRFYMDKSYSRRLADFDITIDGPTPENGHIKGYKIITNNTDLDVDEIVSFGFEIFDKNADVFEKDSSYDYQLEIQSSEFNDLKEDEILLFERSASEDEFTKITDFTFQNNKISFITNKDEFLIAKVLEKEENNTIISVKKDMKEADGRDNFEAISPDKIINGFVGSTKLDATSPTIVNNPSDLKNIFESIINQKIIDTDRENKQDVVEKYIIDLSNEDDEQSTLESVIDDRLENNESSQYNIDENIINKDLEDSEKLKYQQILADIYTDNSYKTKASDDTIIKIKGDLPGYTKVRAYPVEIEIKGKEVLAAYDITFFDESDKEYKVTAKNNVKVQITNKKIKEAKEIEVYHKEDEYSPEEKIDVDSKTYDTITFRADSFSIYAVTDDKAQSITFVFLNRNEKNDREVWDTQTIRNGEYLIEPELPIFSYKGKFEGWYYYNIETDSFGDKFDFKQAVTVTESSPQTIYLKGKYLDVAYINFIDRKKVKNSDGSISYVDEVLATKEIPLGDKVTTNDVPVLPEESGTIFSHWATQPNSSQAFDFNSPITKELIRSEQGDDNVVRLDLYAVFEKALTVTFDSQGGTYVNKQVVYSGDTLSLNDLTKPVRPGYNFKYWSTSPNGSQFNATTPITKDMTLYAVWTPRVVKYTINHLRENADDSGYSLYRSETRTANAGTYTNTDSSAYKLAATTMNNEKIHFVRADERKIIRGDDSTEINLYYDRERFTFRIFESYVLYETDVVNVELKWGADTKPYFDEALRKLPSGYTFKENGIVGQIVTSPPRMPKNDYNLLAWREGSNEWNVRIIDVETNQLIRLDAKTSVVSSSLQKYTGGELIPGYTYKYVERPGNNIARPSTRHDGGKTSKENEVWVYYQRNRHDLTFSTNGNEPDIVRTNILYDSNLSQYAPENYIVGQTKNSEGKIFSGWYDNPTGAGNQLDLKTMTMPDNNLKLYAKWEEPVYTVIAYKQRNNPEAGVVELKVKRGETVDKSKLIADKPPIAQNTPGSVSRWYAYINGILTEYNFSDPVYSDLFLYPVWLSPVGEELRPLSQIYRVKYRAPQEGGGDYVYTDPNEYVNNAEAIVIPPYINNDYMFPPDNNNPYGTKLNVPKDQVFQGWVIDQNSKFTTIKDSGLLKKVFQPGEIVNVIGNIMFMPIFNEYKTTSLTLSEIAPDGSKLDDIIYKTRNKPSDLPNGINDNRPTEDLRNNDTVTLPQPKATNTTGFHFLGWSTTEDPTKGTIFNPDQEVMITDENMPNILYGIWERDRYKVTILNNVTGDLIGDNDKKFKVSYTLEGKVYEMDYDIDNGSSIDVEIPYGSTNISIKSLSNRIVKFEYKDMIYEKNSLDLDSIDGDIKVVFENQPIPPPTGVIDNISSIATLFIIAITALTGFVIYNKKKLGGTID